MWHHKAWGLSVALKLLVTELAIYNAIIRVGKTVIIVKVVWTIANLFRNWDLTVLFAQNTCNLKVCQVFMRCCVSLSFFQEKTEIWGERTFGMIGMLLNTSFVGILKWKNHSIIHNRWEIRKYTTYLNIFKRIFYQIWERLKFSQLNKKIEISKNKINLHWCNY